MDEMSEIASMSSTMRDDLHARFWFKVSLASPAECWLWRGTTTHGYGRLHVNGRARNAHRVSYELAGHSIPDGLTLDHLCRNRACVNPAHLEPVPNAVNVLRGMSFSAVNARKAACVNGHAFDEQNTRPLRYRSGRACRACTRLRDRRRHAGRAQGGAVTTETKRRLRARRRSEGLCARCPTPVAAGYLVCAKHLEYERVRTANRRAR